MQFPIFSKKALFVAATVFGCASLANAGYYTAEQGTNFNRYQNREIILDAFHGTPGTISGSFTGMNGTLIKQGASQIEISGKAGNLYALTGANPRGAMTPVDPEEGVGLVYEAVWAGLDVPMLQVQNQSWISGNLVVEGGVLKLTGYVNAWTDVGDATWNERFLNPGARNGTMAGVSTVTLMNGGTLDMGTSVFDNNPRGGMITANSSNVVLFLNNIRAGENHDQIHSILDLGERSNYHADLHVDAEHQGSVGLVKGYANVYKTGEGTLKVLNDLAISGNVARNSYSGSVFVAGGVLQAVGLAPTKAISNDPTGALARHGYDYEYGHALWNAASVNIAGRQDTPTTLSESSRHGFDVASRSLEVQMEGNTTAETLKLAYFARPDAGTLLITNNQLIRNFQALFAVGAEATDDTRSVASAIYNAANNTSTDAPIVPGTGIGSVIGVKENAILGIYQEAGTGGIYKGSIVGVENEQVSTSAIGGTIVKYGLGDLALVLERANYKSLVVLEGRLISNVEGVNFDPGKYNWVEKKWEVEPGLRIKSGASFVLVENSAATLNTRLEVEEGANLRFSSSAMVTTLGGPVDASNNFASPGTIELKEEQRFIKGIVFVENGVELVLTASKLFDGDTYEKGENETEFSGGSLGLAEAIVVWGKNDVETDKHSRLSFNNTNQVVNNLTGDSLSMLSLGTGTLTLNINSDNTVTVGEQELQYGTFNGAIAPDFGNIVKKGSGTLTLGGGTSVNYYGVLGIAEGNFVATTQYTLNNVSALILNSELSAEFEGSQRIASIYGGKGAKLNIKGAGARLILGESVDRATVLNDTEIPAPTYASIVTNRLNDDSTLMPTGMHPETFEAYFKPIHDFTGTEDSKEELVLDKHGAQWNALKKYFEASTLEDVDWEYLNDLFGRDLGKAEVVTRGDVTRLYLSLFAKGICQTEVEDPTTISGYDVSGKIAQSSPLYEMVNRLAFDGDISVDNLEKVGNTRVTIAGTLKTNSISISGGTLELDWDTLGVTDTENGIEIAGKLADGVSVSEGSFLGINTEGATKSVFFNEALMGRGGFEKKGNGLLEFGDKVAYSGSTRVLGGMLRMSLRNEPKAGDVNAPLAQTSIYIENDSFLCLNQATDVDWNGDLEIASGTLVKEGAGTLTLLKAPTIKGHISVVDGKLIVPEYVPIKDKFLVLGNDAVYQVDMTGDKNFSGEIDGAGTFIKNGTGTLTFDGPVSDFRGNIVLNGGINSIVTENLFELASITVSAGTELTLKESQKFKNLDGEGTITIEDGKELVLKMENEAIELKSNGTAYVMTPSTLPASSKFSGKILSTNTNAATKASFGVNGTGAFVFAGTLGTDVSFDVEKGQLVVDTASVKNVDIKLSAPGEIIFNVEGNTSTNYEGTITSTALKHIGKIGTGTLEVSGKKFESSHINVYQGTLKLTGNQAFDFAKEIDGVAGSATIALGATLEFEYSGSDLHLGNIRGSGTLKLTPTANRGISIYGAGNSMLPPNPSSGDYFNGIISVSNADLSINLESGKDLFLSSIEIDANSTLTINPGLQASNVTILQEQDSTIKGKFSSSSQLLTITGAGRLTIAGTGANAVGLLKVKDGNLQIDATANFSGNAGVTQDLLVGGNAKIYFSSENIVGGSISDKTLSVNVKADGTLNSLKEVKTGSKDFSIDFKNGTNPEIFALDTTTWNLIRNGNTKFSLGVEEGELELKSLSALSEKVNLTTDLRRKEDGSVTTGTLSINVATIGGNDTLKHSISGEGNFKKTGSGNLNIVANQNYYGASTVSAGTISFAEGISLKTSELTLKSGTTLKGGVKLIGAGITTITQETKTITPESISTSVVKTTTREDGSVVKVETLPTVSIANIAGLASGTFVSTTREKGILGGAIKFENGAIVELDVGKNELIAYSNLPETGDIFEAGSMIRLTGTGSSNRGKEIKILNALNPSTAEFSTADLKKIGTALSNSGIENLMITQTGNGSVSIYLTQESFADVKGLELRDGIGESFIDVLDELASPNKGGVVVEAELKSSIGRELNKLSAADLGIAIANLSPIAFSSMIAMPASSANGDIAHLSSRLTQRRYDGADFFRSEEAEFFALAQGDFVTNSKGTDSANYDFNSYGALVGVDTKLDAYTTVGLSVGANFADAKIHENGGKIESEDLRVTLFGGTLLFDSTYYLDFGVHYGMSKFDTKRKTLVGDNKGDTDGYHLGFFANFGKGFVLETSDADLKFHLTPYVGLSYLYSSVEGFEEKGSDSALAVKDFDNSSLKGRLGMTLHWLFPMGELDARLSFDLAYEHEFLDDQTKIDGNFRSGSVRDPFNVDANTFSKDAFTFSPSLNVNLSEKSSIFFGYSLKYGTDENFTQNVNMGFRRSF